MKRRVRVLKIIWLALFILGFAYQAYQVPPPKEKSCAVPQVFSDIQQVIKEQECELILINPNTEPGSEGAYKVRLTIEDKDVDKRPLKKLVLRVARLDTMLCNSDPPPDPKSIVTLTAATPGQDEVIFISGVHDKKVVIQGLVITQGRDGILVRDSNNVEIQDNCIRNNTGGDGIALVEKSVALIKNNQIVGNKNCGIKADQDSSTKAESAGNRIAGNKNKQEDLCGVPPSVRIPEIRLSKHPLSDFPCIKNGQLAPCIQNAIVAAHDNDTILVDAKGGEYVENLSINKPLTLKPVPVERGQVQVVKLKAKEGNNPAITISSSSPAVIERFEITGAKESAGIRILSPGAATIQNSTVSTNKWGIEIIGNAQANITALTSIVGNSSSGIFIKRPEGATDKTTATLIIRSSLISNNGEEGIKAEGEASVQIEEIRSSFITGNGKDGISLSGSSQVSIKDFVEIKENKGHGLALSGRAKADLSGTRVIIGADPLTPLQDAKGNEGSGIVLSDRAEVKVIGKQSTFLRANKQDGITLSDCSTAHVEGAIIEGNRQNGILVKVPTDYESRCKIQEGQFKLEATLLRNSIQGHKFWGVAAFINSPPCFLSKEATLTFDKIKDKVQVTGNGNTMSENGTQLLEERVAGDPAGNVCPRDWSFLMK